MAVWGTANNDGLRLQGRTGVPGAALFAGWGGDRPGIFAERARKRDFRSVGPA
jgi:hypothetical protein